MVNWNIYNFLNINMKNIKRIFLSLILALLLVPSSFIFAQEDYDYEYDATTYDITSELEDSDLMYQSGIAEDDVTSGLGAGLLAFSMGVWLISIAIGIGSYIFSSLALSKIGKEMGYKHTWLAWVFPPVMMMELGDKKWFLLLIPFAGPIFLIIALMNLTEKRGYDKALALITLTGIGSYILLYLLAWKPKNGSTVTPVSSAPTSLEQEIAQAGEASLNSEQPVIPEAQAAPQPIQQPTPEQPQQPTVPTM